MAMMGSLYKILPQMALPRDNKRMIRLGALGVAAIFMAGLCLPKLALAQGQDEVSLEDFLNQTSKVTDTPAPSENSLAASDARKPSDMPAQTPQDVVSNEPVNVPSQQAGIVINQGTADQNPIQTNGVDALPAVNTTRLRIATEGFDNIGTNTISAEFQPGGQDPTRQSQAELAEEIRREAFDAAITGLFPLKPDDIKALLMEYDKTKRAVEEPVYGVPTPRVNVETVSLDPGVPPMSIQTATGHITTLNILDVTGAPWPIQDISWAGDFEIIEPEEGGHIIRITPMSVAAYGNMSIRLLTLKTPLTIMLKTSKDEVQYRVDARIPEFGPFAQTPLIEGGSERVAGNGTIMSVLDGAPPENAQRLEVSGVDGRTTAFKLQGKTYVRTPLTLLSPGWDQSVSSADGMNVYTLEDTPVLLLSDNGRFLRASLSVGKGLFDE